MSNSIWYAKKGIIRFTSTEIGWGDAAVMIPWTLYQYYKGCRVGYVHPAVTALVPSLAFHEKPPAALH